MFSLLRYLSQFSFFSTSPPLSTAQKPSHDPAVFYPLSCTVSNYNVLGFSTHLKCSFFLAKILAICFAQAPTLTWLKGKKCFKQVEKPNGNSCSAGYVSSSDFAQLLNMTNKVTQQFKLGDNTCTCIC